jgi:hypothetical protein
MPLAPTKPGSTIQAYFRLDPTSAGLIHDARIVVAAHAQDLHDCRTIMRALGIMPGEMGIVTG